LVQDISQAFSSCDVPTKNIERHWGISDANGLNRQDIASVCLGYGVKDPHTTREQIAIADMEKVAQFVQKFITQ